MNSAFVWGVVQAENELERRKQVALRQDESISSKFLGHLDVGRRCKAQFAVHDDELFWSRCASLPPGSPDIRSKDGRTAACPGH